MPYVTLPGSTELYWVTYGPRRDEQDPSGPGTTWAEPESPSASTSTSTSYRSIELNPDGSLDLRTDVPTLIVLAPIWLDLSYCQSLFDRFARQNQIVALENRSHGRSTRSPVMPSFEFFVSACFRYISA
ncbi:BZ3500_MvSof-1268-A1-R1_Chr3-1g05882 [Microbotryum saponariae]|uniref:BZ3500_MvSof-1268-A1-R1_Chr3-1g05882 protein n=1 Tax=Microbotryum saponariae TaxID=289078 RepID=A0A2X0NBY5_9BASI|nr:BZ3500_MvSof-1268-A1-R1_Chr3-1g05882 [Microbotryum saponariae]SDA05072.1 BZ3501_MvSof-1269-A2-R1_Chr3-1g05552 [Microbotryum saponariae]